MQSPFPGMNPYLEEPTLWADVHNSFITAIRDQLQAQIAPAYRAVITPYTAFEDIEIAPVRAVIPDVAVLERPPSLPQPGARGTGGSVAQAAPLALPALMEVPVEYSRIELRTVRDHVLVTAIELLSPANKRPGARGADAYERKRQDLFKSTVHLLAIDLLRAGVRPQVARPLPDAPYFLFLSRVQRRPIIEIWFATLREPLPVVPVPLRAPDPDVSLDLTPIVQAVYANARYDLAIDYRAAPPPPDLPPDDAAWLHAHLHAAGLR